MRHWWSSTHRLAKAILEAPDTTLDYDQCLAVIGPRLAMAGTQAHQRQVDRAFRAYTRGLLPIYNPLAQELADLCDRAWADRLAA